MNDLYVIAVVHGFVPQSERSHHEVHPTTTVAVSSFAIEKPLHRWRPFKGFRQLRPVPTGP